MLSVLSMLSRIFSCFRPITRTAFVPTRNVFISPRIVSESCDDYSRDGHDF
jgi:hypothetical protein